MTDTKQYVVVTPHKALMRCHVTHKALCGVTLGCLLVSIASSCGHNSHGSKECHRSVRLTRSKVCKMSTATIEVVAVSEV